MKAFKALIKPFEAPQRRVKIKILLNFFSLSGIVTGKVNFRYFVVFHFIIYICLNSFNIPCHASVGITISSTFLKFTSGTVFGFTIF